jgi:PhnB protein
LSPIHIPFIPAQAGIQRRARSITSATNLIVNAPGEGNPMQIQPYLFFEGRCEEAIAFYKQAVGAKVEMLMRFDECPDQSMISPGSGNKVMHSCIRIGDSAVLASDGRNTGKANFQGFSLTIYAKDEAEADKLFGALGAGGEVRMPLAKTFFSPRFGMLADKFGVGWMVIVAQ